MSEEARLCSSCHLPIHPAEVGVRHMGLHESHSTSRCVELLRAEIQRIERERDEALAQINGMIVYHDGDAARDAELHARIAALETETARLRKDSDTLRDLRNFLLELRDERCAQLAAIDAARKT